MPGLARIGVLALLSTAACVIGAYALVPAADAGTLWLNSCSHLGDNGEDTDVDGLVWQQSGNGAYALFNRCTEGGSFQIVGANPGNKGGSAQWATTAPPSIAIVHAYTPTHDVLITPEIKQDGYAASFYWSGGSETITPQSKCCGGMDYVTGINRGLD